MGSSTEQVTRYYPIPVGLLDDDGISPLARSVWIRLNRTSSAAQPFGYSLLDTIELGRFHQVQPQEIVDAALELEAAGWIFIDYAMPSLPMCKLIHLPCQLARQARAKQQALNEMGQRAGLFYCQMFDHHKSLGGGCDLQSSFSKFGYNRATACRYMYQLARAGWVTIGYLPDGRASFKFRTVKTTSKKRLKIWLILTNIHRNGRSSAVEERKRFRVPSLFTRRKTDR